MIKIIIFFVIGYVLYRSLRSWMFPGPSSSKSVSGQNTAEIDDVMIKDPFCEAYFPKRDAVHLNFDGQDLFFCSARCKDEYLAAHSEKEP